MIKLIMAIVVQLSVVNVQVPEVIEEVVVIEEVEEVEEPDPRWIALVNATWRLETGNGTSFMWVEHNNAGGIKCGVDYCSYESEEQGRESLESLLVAYVDDYGYDLESIRLEYCGSHCGIEDLNIFTQIYNEELNK